MKQTEIYKEVVCDYFDEENKWWTIDAWTDPDEEDNGRVVAWIDPMSGNVYYKDNAAKDSPLAQEVIKAKVAEIKKEYAHKQGMIGETIAMLTSQIWGEIYDKMREPDCTQLSCAIRDAAYKFEDKWLSTPEDERDGYYIDMIDAFAEKTIAEFKDLYC